MALALLLIALDEKLIRRIGQTHVADETIVRASWRRKWNILAEYIGRYRIQKGLVVGVEICSVAGDRLMRDGVADEELAAVVGVRLVRCIERSRAGAKTGRRCC